MCVKWGIKTLYVTNHENFMLYDGPWFLKIILFKGLNKLQDFIFTTIKNQLQAIFVHLIYIRNNLIF